MATGQELKANVKEAKDYKNTEDEKEDILERIRQLKDTIRQSEQKLTGLQRMKYMQEEYDKKEAAFEQMRQMRSQTKGDDVLIEPQVVHSVQEIRSDAKYRFAHSFANLMVSGGLFMVCYFLWQTLNRKVEERQAAQEGASAVGAAADGTNERSIATESKKVETADIPTKSDTGGSIFD